MNSPNSDPTILTQPGVLQAPSEVGSNGDLWDNREQREDAEELNYDSVRPKKTITVTVSYRIRGRGRPLPYLLDEGDGQ